MVIKNIDKREEMRKKNKILLEKLIILGKKYRNLKKGLSEVFSISKMASVHVETFSLAALRKGN